MTQRRTSNAYSIKHFTFDGSVKWQLLLLSWLHSFFFLFICHEHFFVRKWKFNWMSNEGTWSTTSTSLFSRICVFHAPASRTKSNVCKCNIRTRVSHSLYIFNPEFVAISQQQANHISGLQVQHTTFYEQSCINRCAWKMLSGILYNLKVEYKKILCVACDKLPKEKWKFH